MKKDLYIAGVGFSAGGLAPLQQLFNHTPHDSVAYVIVQHLPVNYRTNLDLILAKHSSLRIIEATHDMKIKTDSIYITPPSSYITIRNERFFVVPRRKDRLHPNESIDMFLLSLAEEKKEKAIAIIFSGGGTDGLRGSRAIKEQGGLVLVQEPADAAHPSMPSGIVETGLADFVALPRNMPAIIKHFVENASKREKREIIQTSKTTGRP
jgi:chemotaxis response regulator CheB